MNPITKYALACIAFLVFSVIEAGDGDIVWALLLFAGCVASMWHGVNLWMDQAEVRWHVKREAQALHYETEE